MNPVNAYYLTGFWYNPAGVMERPVFVLISQEREPMLMVSLDVYGHRLGELPLVVSDVRVYTEYPYTKGQPTLVWACRQGEDAGLRGKTLGVEDNYTPLNDGVCRPWYSQAADAFDGTVVPAGSLVNRLRMLKEPEEVAKHLVEKHGGGGACVRLHILGWHARANSEGAWGIGDGSLRSSA